MSTAADRVRAGDPDVADLLRETIALVEHHGGWLAPGTVVVEQDHDLWIEYHGDGPSGTPVVSVPSELLVDVADVEWAEDSLQVVSGGAALTGSAASSLELWCALISTCGKVEHHRVASPMLAAGTDETLAGALAATMPDDVPTTANSPVESFVASRVLGGARPEGGGPRPRRLMPIVDAANHDHEGSPLGIRDGALTITATRPLDTAECFVSYGLRRDPLSLALHYAFASSRSPVASSVPTSVDLAGGRRVTIRGRQPGRNEVPRVDTAPDELLLNHLCLDRANPSTARTHLTMAVRMWMRSDGTSDSAAEHAASAVWDGIVEANEAVLARVQRAAQAHGGTAGTVLADAVDRQLETVRRCRG